MAAELANQLRGVCVGGFIELAADPLLTIDRLGLRQHVLEIILEGQRASQ